MTENQMKNGKSAAKTADVQPGDEDLLLRIDGSQPLSLEAAAAVNAVCDTAEDRGGRGKVIVQVSGAPTGNWAGDLTVSQVSKWERALRRLERLPASTLAVADGDCGGIALDALLATDYRIATGTVRLTVPVGDGATWPGMALYRLAQHGSGAAAIRRAVLFGTPIGVADALALHLVDELADDLDSALANASLRAGAVPGTELAIRRQLMLDAATTSFEEALGVHLAACDRALRRASVGAAS
ncbi:enoyl-CoA hydratase/isomerase family protein [Kitasatospora sp. RB6PN24]|uniref:enoyl-CoA-hydratase DpgB n=1 Tax=Kitasatospora humi TaxID=2893891 RepID=UPI001E5C8571|nr:enoyl-CoA-hydratase DpgB [Kitasatospora humi]MCC9311910.1 enoyl-CoA hydratase/isomerase family protein [Kitasatospora humi]